MAKKESKLKAIMTKNPMGRNRILLLLGVGVVFVGAGAWALSGSGQSHNNSQPAGATVSTVPNVSTAVGVSTSTEYNKKLNQVNQEKTNEALNSGNTFIPTPVNNNPFGTVSPLDNLDHSKKEPVEEKKPEEVWITKTDTKQDICPYPQVGEITSTRTYLENETTQVRKDYTEWLQTNVNCKMPVQAQQQVKVQQPIQPKGKYSYRDAALLATLSGYWSNQAGASEFNYAGQKAEVPANQQGINSGLNTSNVGMNTNQTMNNSQSSNSASVAPLAKAGDIFYAVLRTPINSDTPSPVLADVTNGPLKGARLVGNFQRVGEKVVVQFNIANVPGYSKSMGINAVAIDAGYGPGAGNTNLADDVNHHYFLKYGILLASSFLSGYADAIGRQNTTVTTSPIGGTTIAQGELDSKQINRQALGEVGKELSSQVKSDYGNLQPTVTVNEDGKGSAIGILLMSDLTITNN